jgi:putative oxidoreductase
MKKIFSTYYSASAFNLGTLALRVLFGTLMFVNHGIGKLMHFEERRHTFYDPFQLGSQWSLSLVIFAEMFCSLLLVLGLFTRFALLPLIITMGVVVFLVNQGKPFEDYELSVLYLTVFFALLLTGPGRFSIDAAISK